MTDIIGPANAPNSVTDRPAETRVFGLIDTWLKDCSSSIANDGTAIKAPFLNGIIGQFRGLIRGNGNTGSGVAIVAENNADDTMALKAVQHIVQRGQPSYAVGSGSANAIVASLTPALAEYKPGIEIRVRVALDNTGPATMNVNGLGAKPIIHPDGAALAAGDLRAGQVACFIDDGVSFQLASAPLGVLTANLGYYVNAATGSDANSGLSWGQAFATIQRAVDKATSFNLNGYSVVIYIADGSYTYATLRRFTGTGSITLYGNPANPGNVVLTGPTGFAVFCEFPGYYLNGLRLQSPAPYPAGGMPGAGLLAAPGAVIDIRNIEYGYCYGYHAVADGGTIVLGNGAQRIAGSSQYHLMAQNAGSIRRDGINQPALTLLNAVNFTAAFISAVNLGVTQAIYSSITNPGYATGQRYLATGNGVIASGGGGASYYPGSSAGNVSSGGQYL